MEKKYLTIGEAAEKLNVSSETLRRWDKSGKFLSSRHPINNYRVYHEDQVLKLSEDLQLELNYFNHEIAERLNKPVFQTSLGELYHVDAIDFLKSLETESIDLIFADPPYNIGKADWDSFNSMEEYLKWTFQWVREAHRVLKKSGSLYICGFSEILADIKYKTSPLFSNVRWLVWFYRNKANLGNDWGRSHESILHFRKSKNHYFDVDKVRIPYNEHTLKYPERTQAETSQYSHNKKNSSIWIPHPLGAKPKDVLEIPTISNGAWERFSHPTQKPVELLRKIILSSSEEGDLVIDPFGGSGTTFAVAEAYSRNWKGTDLQPEFIELIRQRLSDNNHLERIKTEKDTKDSNSRRSKLRSKK